MKRLKEIVSKVFDADIVSKTRKRNNVEARMIFSKIARENKNTFLNIGKEINRDHSTVVYYISNVDALINQIPSLKNKYLDCKKFFLTDEEYVPEEPVSKELAELKLFTETLISDMTEIIKVQEKYMRIEKIINLVDERTHFGKEDFIEKKINELFNSI